MLLAIRERTPFGIIMATRHFADKQTNANQKAIAGIVACFMIMGAIVTWQSIRLANIVDDRSERIVNALERIVRHADQIGVAVAEKSVDAIKNMDTEEMSKGLSKGAKEIGNAAKERAVDYFKKDPWKD